MSQKPIMAMLIQKQKKKVLHIILQNITWENFYA